MDIKKSRTELEYLATISVFLRKLFSSQQGIQHAKIHLLHREEILWILIQYDHEHNLLSAHKNCYPFLKM
jgi:hypothetical protein